MQALEYTCIPRIHSCLCRPSSARVQLKTADSLSQSPKPTPFTVALVLWLGVFSLLLRQLLLRMLSYCYSYVPKFLESSKTATPSSSGLLHIPHAERHIACLLPVPR